MNIETQPGKQPTSEQLIQEISEILKDPRYKKNPKKLIFLSYLLKLSLVKNVRILEKGPEVEIKRSPLEILGEAWGYKIPNNLEDLITPQKKIKDENFPKKSSPQEPIINKDKPKPPQSTDLNLP